MRKIPTLFVRDEEDRRYVTAIVSPGCEWVMAGEGVPTRKYDGTCVMLAGHAWWSRREVKPGKSEPAGFVAVTTDDATGKTVGWEPIEQSPFVKFHTEALGDRSFPEGTYELCGPKVNGNPEGYDGHRLVRHADAEILALSAGEYDVGQVMDMVREVAEWGWEGIVWHHPDGRMAKLKARDLASPRKVFISS